MSQSLTQPERACMSDADRVIRVGFYVFFPGGGIGRYTHELMRVMGERPGVEVEVLCTPDYEWTEADGYATWDGLKSISHDVATLRRLRFLVGQFVNPRRAIRHAVERGLDVLHLANINHLTFPYWRTALDQTGLKIVASAHDVKRQKSIIHRAWEDRQLKAFYRLADALFVHSDYQARELVQFADVRRDKIVVVPHGPYPHGSVDASKVDVRKKWNLPEDRQVALFFGQLRDEKNLDSFLRAVSLAETPIHVVVAGQGGGRHREGEYYKKLAGTVDITSRVTFVSRYIDDEEVGELFVASDWVALPYHTSFTSQSGVLNVAAFYERPVLVSSAPVLRETVEVCDIGYACEGDTPAQIAQGIDTICQRIEGGYEHAFADYKRRFSWEENVSRTLNVYQKLLQ